MRILLLGEYSGLHNNLKQGLRALGHDVTLAATGDGFKKFTADINFDGKTTGPISKLERFFKYIYHLNELTGFDVVQIINPIVFSPKFNINEVLLKYIINKNKKVSMLGAGCDAFFWQKTRHIIKYGPYDSALKYDYKSKKHPHYDSKQALKWNEWLSNRVDFIIPIMYEYQLGYKDYPNACDCIPLPLDVNQVPYSPNIVSDKLVVFHGLNRYGFKGTKIVEDAFEELKRKYPNDLDLVIAGKLPISDYLSLMSKTNVIIDQLYSHSCGMNAIYALAMGKVVLGGAEPESLISLNIKDSPVINVKPTKESIINNVEFLLENKNLIEGMGRSSREFVEKNHDCLKIAKMYIDIWSK